MYFDSTPLAGRIRWLPSLLLAPAVLLASLAGWSLLQDRNAALGEAGVRARDVADVAARAVGGQLMDAATRSRSGSSLRPSQDQSVVTGTLDVDAEGRLISPPPFDWPPSPAPLPPLQNTVGRALWTRAQSALTEEQWTPAITNLILFIGTLAPRDSNNGQPELPMDIRYARNAEWLLATAHERAGSFPTEDYLRLASGEGIQRTESGAAIQNLAALRIIEAIQSGKTMFPQAWNSNAEEFANRIIEWPPTPLRQEVMDQLEKLSRQGNVAAPLGNVWANLQKFASRENRLRAIHRAWRSRAREQGSGSTATTVPTAHGEVLLLAMNQSSVVADGSSRPLRWGVVTPDSLNSSMEPALQAVDPRRQFAARISVIGPGFELEASAKPSGDTLATSASQATPALRVVADVTLRDSATYFASVIQRRWIFGSLLGVSLLVSAIAALAVGRTLRRQYALAVRQSNFVASVSHELRAPIASVRLLSESLETDRVTQPEDKREFLQLLGRECRRLSTLIENVLDLGRVERGRKEYHFEPLDLRALTAEVIRLMEPIARDRNVVITPNLPVASAPCEMTGDASGLQQALTNLIDNAIKHSPVGETVRVNLESRVGGGWIWAIADRGCGVPVSERKRIFEPFHRLGSELRRETAGVGIGLTIVRHVVEAHHGKVWMEPNPGGGSRFCVELPVG